MPDHVNPALVLAHARAWIGTPFVPRGSLRGCGADCIGFIRGLVRELAGRDPGAPPWRHDWGADSAEPILNGLAAHVAPVPIAEARPGHIVTYRVGAKRAAHVAVLTETGGIHAWEVGGVKETAPLFGREITSAWAIPCADECFSGPASLAAEDCLAVIHPGHVVEISVMLDATPLARSAPYPDAAAALAGAAAVYTQIETVR